MDLIDTPKATFMSNHDNYYYYNIMPFGLKNVGTAYQRLMDTVFSKKIGHKLEVYIDDMTVNTLKGESHATNLEDILRLVRNYNMCLNLAMCSFGVQAGKLLGFMLTKSGIEENPYKVKPS